MKLITKKDRQLVFDKYNGHCAYCGKEIEYKDMQVDHVVPQALYPYKDDKCHHIDNLNPACRRCNHYKRAATLKEFRITMQTLHERIQKDYICKVAIDYGIITLIPFSGKFYFETINQ